MTNPKEKVHAAAKLAWEQAGRRGIVVGATGIGKTKIALDRVDELNEYYRTGALLEVPRVLLLVPTEKARDNVWLDEAKKWNVEYSSVEGLCYVSAAKASKKHYHLLILDEGHHVTPAVASILTESSFDEILVLTAIVPGKKTEVDREKWSIFIDLDLPVVFKYPVEDAVKDGVVSDFTVHVVELELDNKQKIYKAGGKKKSWFNTEKQEYEYMDKQMLKLRLDLNNKEAQVAALHLGNFVVPHVLLQDVKTLQIRLNILIGKRARFIYNLPTKGKYASYMLQKILNTDVRTRVLVFNGSIQQSADLCGALHVFDSKSTSKALEDFQSEQSRYLCVVNAADESHNFPNLDYALIVQASSVARRMVQRIGRVIRYREGHKANIIILMVKNTVDEKWVESALSEIDPSRIKRYKR